MKIVLLPLDERPVNTRYPRMIGDIAGLEVSLPPLSLLPNQRNPADTNALIDWLYDEARDSDGVVASLDMLAYGGLIPSRISNMRRNNTLIALHALEDLKQKYPGLYVSAFNAITRIPNANDAIEEPEYWATYGKRLHRYSQLMHRHTAGENVAADLRRLRDEIPAEHIRDFTQRRLRNHTLNLALVGSVAAGALDFSVICSDDTSVYGYGSQEKAWLQTWASRFHADIDGSRLLMYPGADEVGCVLMMRAALRGQDAPTFAVRYAIDADQERVAPYEDSPIHVTVSRQIQALGGIELARQDDDSDIDAADFVVAVNPPSGIQQEYTLEHPYALAHLERRVRYLERFVDQMLAWLRDCKRVILCDVAYPNGSDPDLMTDIISTPNFERLAAYGAWNTAGNSIGVALAQGVASALATTEAQHEAQRRFLLHRFVEDYLYQHNERAIIRNWLADRIGQHEVTPENMQQVVAKIEADLNAALDLFTMGERWRVTNVALPWQRTFEVDFDLERV